MKKISILLFLMILGILLALYYSFISRPTADVYIVQRGTAVSAVYGTVKIEYTFSVEVRAQNMGFINFAEGISSGAASIGAELKKGRLLATILDEETSSKISLAKTDLAAAVQRQKLGAPSLPNLKAQEAKLVRIQKLAELKHVPISEAEKALAEVASLRDQAKNEQIQLERELELVKENLKHLQERQSQALIRSPMDGVLTAVEVTEGALVLNNSSLFTVSTQNTYVLGKVNEEDVGQLRPGMKASVRLYSFPNEEFEANLSRIVPTGDSINQNYSVILHLEKAPPNLLAGMTGEMNIIIGKHDNSLIIPTRALLEDHVLIVADGVIKTRKVQAGYRNIERVEILDGLRENDLVVVADQDILRSGQRVRPVTVNSPRTQ